MYAKKTPTAFYYNIAGADISQLTSWGTNIDGSGAHPNNFSDASLFFKLYNTGATLGSNLIISGVGSQLIIGNPAGVTFTIPTTAALTGNIQVDSLSTLYINNTTVPFPLNGSGGSSIVFTGLGVKAPKGTYGDLTLMSNASVDTGVIKIKGQFNTAGTNVPAPNGSTINFLLTYVPGNPPIDPFVLQSFTYDSLSLEKDVVTAYNNVTIKVNKGFSFSTIYSNKFFLNKSDTLIIAGNNGASLPSLYTYIESYGTIYFRSLVPINHNTQLEMYGSSKYIVDADVSNGLYECFIPSIQGIYQTGTKIIVNNGSPRLPSNIDGSVIWNSPNAASVYNNDNDLYVGENLTINNGTLTQTDALNDVQMNVTISGNLELNGGSYYIVGNSNSTDLNVLSVTGDFTINSPSSKFYANNGASRIALAEIDLQGNLYHNTGAFGNNSDTANVFIYFTNSSDLQTINTTGITGTCNVNIHNPNNVILLSGDMDLKKDGKLTFDNGKLIIGDNNVAAGFIENYSAIDRYVVTNGNGYLKKYIDTATAATDITLPIGNTNNNRSTYITFNSGFTAPSYVEARCIDSIPGNAGLPIAVTVGGSNAQLNVALPNYWEIHCPAPNVNYDISFEGNGQTGINDIASVFAIKRSNNTSNWALEGTLKTSAGTPTNPYIHFRDLTSFSQFAIGYVNPLILPLKLIYFNGTKMGNNNLLDFKVAVSNSVTNKFIIERSANGRLFSPIQTITATALQCVLPFSYTDNNLSENIYFYRIKMIEANGSFIYSNIIKLANTNNNTISIYPNPVKDVATVTNVKLGGVLLLTDVNGKLLQQIKVKYNSFSIDMTNYNSGIYLLKIENEVVQKIIKQ